MRFFSLLFFSLFFITVFSQNSPTNKSFPLFDACSETNLNEEDCFRQALQKALFHNYKEPDLVLNTDYVGVAILIFQVNDKGIFQPVYIENTHEEVKIALQQAIKKIPAIQPATYNKC